MKHLVIDVEPEEYSVVRLDPADGVPEELFGEPAGPLVSVTRTGAETSVVCRSDFWSALDARISSRVEEGWRLLSVHGPLEFTLTGIIAALSSELASAGVAIFTLSTFDTDHVLVKAPDLARAVDALELSGHKVHAAQR